MPVSPNADAQASNSWTPRSNSASGDWKRSSVYISPNVLVIGVPEAWMSARRGFFWSMKRDLTNRSQARCEPSGSTPFRLTRLVAKESFRNLCVDVHKFRYAQAPVMYSSLLRHGWLRWATG